MNIIELDTPQKRLEYFLDLKGITYTDFANSVGVSPYSRSRYVGSAAKNVYRRADIIQKMKEIGLNHTWYLLGIGDPMLDSEETKEDIDTEYMTETKNVKMVKVPVLEKLEDLPYKELMLMREKMTEYLNKINEMFSEKKD